MKSAILAVIFAAHALAFARIYLVRGRRLFSLLLVVGFLLLVAYYTFESWQMLAAAPAVPGYMAYVRWGGIAVCLAGLPLFLVHLARGFRGRGFGGGSLDRRDADY